MPNRMTFMERMSGRLAAIESVLKKLEPVESLLERITLLENTIFTTKRVFTFQEACMYIGVSESMLYKLTSSKEIPHYKPRGKMVYFAKEELDEWLLQNYEPTMNEAVRRVTEAAATEPAWGWMNTACRTSSMPRKSRRRTFMRPLRKSSG